MARHLSIYLAHQVTPFVILFVERAGSTYLSSLLNSHPAILALREKLAGMIEDGMGPQDQLLWIEEFFSPPLISRHAARGFKTKLGDILDPEGFVSLMRQKNCRILQLMRRNSVKGVVSTVNARRLWEATGNWNLLEERNRRSPFEIDEIEFDTLLQNREQLNQELVSFANELHLPTLQLFYEDLLQDQTGFLNQIFSFIEVKSRSVRGKTIKHTEDNLRAVLHNFDQLRSRYSGTKYEAMFDEVIS